MPGAVTVTAPGIRASALRRQSQSAEGTPEIAAATGFHPYELKGSDRDRAEPRYRKTAGTDALARGGDVDGHGAVDLAAKRRRQSPAAASAVGRSDPMAERSRSSPPH